MEKPRASRRDFLTTGLALPAAGVAIPSAPVAALATDHLLQVFRVPSALHRDL